MSGCDPCDVVLILCNLCRKRYVDKHNQDIVDRVVKEVKGVDSAVPTFQIRGQCEFFVLCILNFFTMLTEPLTEAGKRFFHTKLEEESLKSRGKYDEKVIKQRKRNRLTRVGKFTLLLLT